MPSPNYSRLPVIISIAALVCALIATLVWHFTVPPPSASPFAAVPKVKPQPVQKAKAAAPVIQTSSKRDPRSIDPDIQRLADDLASKEQSPIRDLEIVNEFITLYSKAFQGNPIGMNEDITAVLTGHNYTKGILFPPDSPMIVKGQIVDRWGSPYWFHPSSGTQMEIRSPGPDKNLFTMDDVVINPGPERFGAVTEAGAQ